MNGRSPQISPNRLFHLKLVARIALSVSGAAAFCLLLAIGLATGDTGATYGEIIASYSLTSRHLGPLLLVSGLAIAAIAGFVTWLIALYASFRIAGPLFRIARNLEMAIERGPVTPVPIRRTDLLQREWAEISATMATVGSHYGELREALKEAERALDADAAQAAPLARAIGRLKDSERHVRL